MKESDVMKIEVIIRDRADAHKFYYNNSAYTESTGRAHT